MSTSQPSEIKKGLEGVVVDESTVSKVMPEINSLVYRGYTVQELSEKCSFEEVAYLLWHGELPTTTQLVAFMQKEKSLRALSPGLSSVIKLYPKSSHPMDTIRSSVSYMGLEEPDVWAQDRPTNLNKAMTLLARIPTAIAADYRVRRGLQPIAPKNELSMSENFFHMCFGEVPHKDIIRAFEVSLILYAEHGFNASTFTARVVASSQSDMYSAITAAIGSLKGPLHGGANEQVMHVLKEIGEPQAAKAWLEKALVDKRKIMGFGHRVYKNGDSRVPTMDKYGRRLAEIKGEKRWHEIGDILAREMLEKKNIHPNLDFPAGPAYYLMGFDIDMFTPIFVMARITGWAAHVMEQMGSNRLIRPLQKYVGQAERRVQPISGR
jgi:2-methylcitrate synthase